MKDLKSICKIAVVQATPIMFDKDKCLEKVISIIEECASNGAEFVVFSRTIYSRLSLWYEFWFYYWK